MELGGIDIDSFTVFHASVISIAIHPPISFIWSYFAIKLLLHWQQINNVNISQPFNVSPITHAMLNDRCFRCYMYMYVIGLSINGIAVQKYVSIAAIKTPISSNYSAVIQP